MNREEAANYINNQLPEFLPAAKVKGQYICPNCGHGKGGDGLRKYKGHWKCFGSCGENHNVIGWYAIYTGLQDDTANFKEALEGAAEWYRIDIDSQHKTTQTNVTVAKKPQGTINEDPQGYIAACMKRLQETNYLQARGISAETCQKFHIGYDPNYSTFNMTGSGRIPATWKAIIIPTGNGSYIARNTDPEATARNKVRKSGTVHLFYTAIPYADSPIYIVEGEIDALSIHEAGGQAIGLGGISNIKKLVEALANGKENIKENQIIVPILDNDEPGQKAQEELIELLKAEGIRYYDAGNVYTYTDVTGEDLLVCKDANEMLQADKEAFTGILENITAEAIEQAKEYAPKGAKILTPTEEVDAFIDVIQTLQYEPLPTGIKDIDDLLNGGFIRQQNIFLSAAPGMGKTTLCQQIAESMARQGHSVIYFNLEMSKEQMLARSLARIGAGDLSALQILQAYKQPPEVIEQIKEAAEVYKNRIGDNLEYNPQYFSTEDNKYMNCNADLDNILKSMNQAAIKAKKEDKPAPVCFIDYLHLLRGRKGEDAAETIKRAVETFKDYAVDNNTIVFIIGANNRTANKTGRAAIDTGRDTSAIEYSGDVMLSLNYKLSDRADGETTEEITEKIREYRDRGQEVPQEYRLFSLCITKARFGEPYKRAILEFDGKHSKFKQIERAAGFKRTGGNIAPAETDEPTKAVLKARRARANKRLDYKKAFYAVQEMDFDGNVTTQAMADYLGVSQATVKKNIVDLLPDFFKLDGEENKIESHDVTLASDPEFKEATDEAIDVFKE